MDIRKYLVQLNSSGQYVPMVYDKASSNEQMNKNKGLMCNKNRSTIKHRTAKQLVFDSDNQYALDLGQHDFDPIECKVCKMLYARGEGKDEKHHSIYHDQFVNSLKFPVWKLERTVFFFNNGDKIISIYPNDPKHMINKIEELVRTADEELGINVPFVNLLENISFFLVYVTQNLRIGGFTGGERINEAYELIFEQPWKLSNTSQVAQVGIARLWVHKSFRRQKFATRLVDILRANLYKDRIIAKDRITFSESTTSGIEFARDYTNRNLLVYTSRT